MKRLLLLVILATSAFATEIAVAPLRYGPTVSSNNRVDAIVRGPNSYLVQSRHVNPEPLVPDYVSIRTFTHDGRPLQPASVAVGDMDLVSRIWNGRAYELVGLRPGYPYDRGPVRIEITETGSIIRTEAPDPPYVRRLSATFGDVTLIAAGQTLTLVDAEARVLRTESIAVTPLQLIARDGDFAIAAIAHDEVLLVPVSRRGEAGTPRVIASEAATAVALAHHRGETAIAWSAPGAIRMVTLDANDEVASRADVTTSTAPLDGVIWNGSGFEVLHMGGIAVAPGEPPLLAGVMGGVPRVATSLAALPAGRPLNESAIRQSSPVVSPTPSGQLVAWTEHDPALGYVQLHLTHLRRDRSSAGLPREVSPALMVQSGPAFARAGDRTLLVWTDSKGLDAYVRGVLLDDDGAAIGAPFDVRRGTATSVTTNGREFFVVGRAHTGTDGPHPILANAITAEGFVQPTRVLVTDTGVIGSVSAAWTGREFAIAYLERERGRDGIVVELLDRARVSLARDADPHSLTPPRLACGATCLAVWTGAGSLHAVPLDGAPREIAFTDAIVSPLRAAPDGTFSLLTSSGPRLLTFARDGALLRATLLAGTTAYAGDVAFDGQAIAVYSRTIVGATRVFLRIGEAARLRPAIPR